MENKEIIKIPKEYKHREVIKIKNEDIKLPKYVKSSISKYRFLVEDNNIYIQRKCNKCNIYFSVQQYYNGHFNNFGDDIRFLGEISGFHNICNTCASIPQPTSKILRTVNNKDTETQLNLDIDKELKNYYKILAIKNGTTLRNEIINALISYKNSID